MRIIFHPVSNPVTLAIKRTGPAKLDINGDMLDLSSIPAGSTIKNANALHPMLAGDIEITEDGPEITVILPYQGDAPESVRFPEPINVTKDGPISLPGQEA